MIRRENIEILDELIVGRVQPHIYAFTTNTIPNYLKVGDTYRPVTIRLQEWRKYFPQLQQEFEDSAAISDDVFFRDYSVHQYLEHDLSKHRLLPGEYPNEYYSNEFFKDVQIGEVSDAIKDIKYNYYKDTGKYQYYDATTQLPETYTYASTGQWSPRPNQQATIDRFVNAVQSGRTNLLMYAVMRFGKSFTSMCCAKAINAKVILVVSAKADVREEWKKTVQSADNFNTTYEFLTSDDLNRNKAAVKETIENSKGAVLFLTLQDLQGETIKDKHTEVFGQQIDLLIVDETHYGARAESYGKILRDTNDVKNKHDNDDYIETEDAEEQLKSLQVKITLHLSGTPYRILMGSEFTKDDIIAFYQFSDIVQDQEQWDRENLLNDNNDTKEWDNPYFGFPQMIRFAFVPSKSALELLESMKSNGITYAFSELLKPQSIKKDNSTMALHKKFVHEAQVLELFEVIDGCREDEGLLSFLDYDRIKDGKMCQHIVCVLPYCASCDALEELIARNRDEFKNLQDYVIINISGVESPSAYKTTQAIKSKIKSCATDGKKTLTLTVNRMLTGSTVEEWDTMLFMKDTASPQEYDQAIFRLQNQYIRELVSENGDIIKYNMKPQTLLVDFDPHRMFIMQEKKSQIYNVNTDISGNEHLRDRLEVELRISPIITLNANRVVQVEAADILAAVSEYSNSRGVIDETVDIPIDMSLLSDDIIKFTIEMQAELGSKQGLSIDANKGQETNLDDPDDNNGDNDDDGYKNKNNVDNDTGNRNSNIKDEDDNIKSLENKFRTYYSRILFFAFLTKSKVFSLSDILTYFDDDDNVRIAKNLSLEKNVLTLIREHINVFVLRQLDYKIQNINTLAHDENLEPMQRASVAIKKFGRISESEITTPDNIATDMVNLLPDDCFTNLRDNEKTRILDIASKMGEFAVAIMKRCTSMDISLAKIKSKIVSIPTSSIAYEFTRKVYEILGIDVNAIASQFNSYDLLNVKKYNDDGTESKDIDYQRISNILRQKNQMCNISLVDNCIDLEECDNMEFNAVIGNPPYQEDDGGAGASARPIYPFFVDISRKTSSSYATMIIPTRWFVGGKNLEDFRKTMLDDKCIKELHDCLHPEEIFPNTNNRGGICYFLWDRNYDNGPSKMKVVTHEGNGICNEYIRSLRIRDMDIFFRNNKALSILEKVVPDDSVSTMSEYISAAKAFGFRTFFISDPKFRENSEGLLTPIKCYGRGGKVGFVERNEIHSHEEWIEKWKVFIPESNNVGTELNDDNQNSFVGAPNEICTETYLCVGAGMNLNEQSAKHLSEYLRTKFARFLLSLSKNSQHGTSKTYRFVPVMDFKEEWTDAKLYEFFKLTQDEIALIEKSIKPMD